MPFEHVFWSVFLLLVAPAVGSFLGVLVDRLPRREDVLGQRSSCRSCGAKLGPLDLIPILSFIALRGKCRYCHTALAGWHLYLEIAALGLAVMAVSAGGDPIEIWLNALFLWVLLGLMTTDLLWFRLPDALNIALAVITAAMAAQHGLVGLFGALAGAAMASGSFMALRIGYHTLRRREGLGMGDVKLMVGLGAFSGPFDVPVLLLMASLGALAAGLVVHLRARVQGAWATRRLPFGAALCCAAIVIWVFRHLTAI